MVILNAIETKNLTKRFGDFTAIDHVSFSIKQGEIHSICGENGAGKSTLMNMLFGLLEPTEGQVLINGKEVHFTSPKEAINYGIGMVHQHFKLVPSLKVYENVMLGEERSKAFGKIDTKKEIQEVQDTIDRFGFNLQATDTVADLSVGAQQRVEIIKMLHRDVEILILDEPTAVLTPNETDELLDKLIELRNEGKTIVMITHKLDEVKKSADRITVIRKGEYVGTVNTSEVNQQQISRLMVGRDVITVVSETKHAIQTPIVFETKDVQLKIGTTEILKNININIRAGEVVGIAGIEGNGQSELIAILTGMTQKTSGKVIYHDKPIEKITPTILRDLGFGLVPEDRYKHGLNQNMNIWQNMIAGRTKDDGVTKNYFFIDQNIKKKTKNLVDEFDIRNSETIYNNVSTLSGGNAQKIIMAREFASNPEIIIMSQPTRGVDVGSIEFIHSKILEFKKKGKAILLVSSEITEILNLSDRIYVMYEGEVSGERLRNETNKEDIGMLMVGIDEKREEEVTL